MIRLKKRFPVYRQLDAMDCGPTCLRMIAKYYGKNFTLQTLRAQSQYGKEGVSFLGITEAAEYIGFRVVGARISYEQLRDEAPLPCIIHWDQNHFVVVYKITKKFIYIADPERGEIKYTPEEFMPHWISTQSEGIGKGMVLLMEPTRDFYKQKGEAGGAIGFGILFDYIKPFKKLIFQVVLGLVIGTLVQLVFPVLTQSIVDVGIQGRNINFIYLILAGQLMLLIGKTSIEFVRNWILLHISTRVNVSILSDFLIKLMKLPIPFFDTKMTGDIMQRMNDQHRIEQFLTGSTLNILFSLLNLVAFTILLAWYSLPICGIFLAGSAIYFIWIKIFLAKRRRIDYLKFEISAKNQSKIIQLIHGMQEIKLNNVEKQKRWEWEKIQAKLFKANVKSLSLSQNQQAGAFFINEGKNILITVFAASAVINGHISLGVMLAIQYIIGQLNGPIEQLIQFVQTTQDARISMERLNEIHTLQDEEPKEYNFQYELPEEKSLSLHQVNFTYPGAGNEPVLKNINLEIPFGKITAIVGMSGSGKTTLLKLLLKFYEPDDGIIGVGTVPLTDISHTIWRSKCGVVMQEGFIFSDTIASNITVVDDNTDIDRLNHAIRVANIQDLVDTLPMGMNTKIGPEGHGISQGQKQRVLIARSVYKDPEFIFFDEATNSLDATNESVIMHNLDKFFKGRTVVIVAHRLSTVKNADNIVVLDKGEIIEQGTHYELAAMKGAYYTLVKNQLELDA